MADFTDKTVLIGVSGGIAAYKVVELARLLVQADANVKVIMTAAAERFVTPLTFRTVTGNPVATSLWSDASSPFPHISLSDEADLIVVAPATANIIAKHATGRADDLLSTTLLAARGTVVFAPAMNTRMYLHPATRRNLDLLRERGAVIAEPGEGGLACGHEGVGRMAEPAEIMAVLEREIARSSDLTGKRVMVTAGPTREFLDPVRFISNPSTGRMGFIVAERAARRGASVLLVSGPTELPSPAGVQLVRVVTTAELERAVLDNLADADALVMAAAPADYRPVTSADRKLSKTDGVPELKLEPTEDILTKVSKVKGACTVVGFAAETHDVLEHARSKLAAKGMDMIVANQVNAPDSGFAAATNRAAVLTPGDETAELTLLGKAQLADLILDRISDINK